MEEDINKSSLNPMYVVAGVVILAVVGVTAYFLFANKSTPSPTEQSTQQVQQPTQQVDESEAESEVKTFNISNEGFSFNPSEIKVNVGDKVKIVFTSSGGQHDWAVDEFNAKTDLTEDGETSEVEFTADQAGTFEFYCSVSNHRQMGMVGNLVVE